MRANISTIATVFVALLFVSGTVGCRSNGGDWYNPKSYAFTNPFANVNNPFAKDNQAPPFSPDSTANSKPSTNSQPNVSVPPGGYTDEAYANRAGSANMTTTHSMPAHWEQPNPMAQHGSSTAYGGYSDPEPSQYASYSDYAKQNAAPASYQHSPNPNPYLYQAQAETAQQANSQVSYGNDYMQSSYHATSAYAAQPPANSVPTGAYGTTTQGYYAPFGATPQVDPYASTHQYSGVPTPSPTSAYEQPAPGPHVGLGYPGEYAPTAPPYQPPAIGGGYPSSY